MQYLKYDAVLYTFSLDCLKFSKKKKNLNQELNQWADKYLPGSSKFLKILVFKIRFIFTDWNGHLVGHTVNKYNLYNIYFPKQLLLWVMTQTEYTVGSRYYAETCEGEGCFVGKLESYWSHSLYQEINPLSSNTGIVVSQQSLEA